MPPRMAPNHDPEPGPDSQSGRRRITTAGARRMLGMIGRNYDDDDIAEIVDILYTIAEAAYDDYAAADCSE